MEVNDAHGVLVRGIPLSEFVRCQLLTRPRLRL